MTDKELDEIEARVNALPPGPWFVDRMKEGWVVMVAANEPALFFPVLVRGDEKNQLAGARLVAAMRTDIPVLIDAVRRLKGSATKKKTKRR